MSVYQVEEYYICTAGLSATNEQKSAIENLLREEGYSNYHFEDGGQLFIDDISNVEEGEELESKIYELLEE